MFRTKRELRDELSFEKAKADKYLKEIEKLRDNKSTIAEKDKTINALKLESAKKDQEIEKLKRELDILYRYYMLDVEPSQDVKTAVRIDKRVYDLETENAQLRMVLMNFLRLENKFASMPPVVCAYRYP